MVPTFRVGTIVTADLDAYKSASPRDGDIVIFHPSVPANDGLSGKGPSGQCGVNYGAGKPCPAIDPRESKVLYIKRIVAGPGDLWAMRDGHVIRNGKLLLEPFIEPCHAGDECNFPTQVKVPAGHYVVLGDNRGKSDDSRFWGPIPAKWIVGRVELP
jgi:signal peptidase I